MPNSLDIIAADPMGSLNSWQQDLAKTAQMQSQATILGAEAAVAPQKQAASLAEMAANTQALQLANQKVIDSTADDKAFREALGAIDPSAPLTTKLGEIASSAIKVGKVSEAEAAIKTMQGINSQEALQDRRRAKADLDAAKMQGKKFDRMMQLMRAMDSAEIKPQLEDLFKQEFGVEAPTARWPWSPDLQRAAVSALEKQQAASKTAAENALTAQRLAAIDRADKVGKAQVRLYEARVEDVRVQTERRVKDGGKGAAPTKREVESAEAYVKNAQPGLGSAARRLAAEEIAADAKIIQQRDAGSYADAVEQAYEGRKGQFFEIDGTLLRGVMGIGEPSKLTYGKRRSLTSVMKEEGDAVADVDFRGVKKRITSDGQELPTPLKKPPPKVGDEIRGYRFKGGEPGDKNNWEKL